MSLVHSVNAQDELIFTLQGELDALGSSEIRDEFEQLIEAHDHPNVTVDFGEVTFIDSSGIGAVVFLFKALKSQQRQLRLLHVQGQPLELIQVLRIDHVVPVNQPL